MPRDFTSAVKSDEVKSSDKGSDVTNIKGGGILPIYSVTPFTMLDFPGQTACVIWFSGCNMRCSYCHNPQIVKGRGKEDIGAIMSFLEKRKGLLDGVVLSGGEATLYAHLPDFVRKIRQMGYMIKLDTNGTRPDIVRDFIKNDLVDYIALDYKAPPEKFKAVTGINKFALFEETLDYLCRQKKIDFEVRTTVHTDLLDEMDITSIMNDLSQRDYNHTYFVQNFRSDNNRPTLGFLPPQKRALDLSLLPEEKDLAFFVSFRNF